MKIARPALFFSEIMLSYLFKVWE